MSKKAFPVKVARFDPETVRVEGPGFRFVVCAHGARELARRLQDAADSCYCDGYRHGNDSTMFVGTPPPVKRGGRQ